MTTTLSASAPINPTVSIAPHAPLLNPWKDRLRLAAGPALGALVYFLLPEAYAGASGSTEILGQAGRATAAVGVWMAVWWMTEAIHLSVTALLPIALLPLLGAGTVKAATTPYGHPLVLLFLGGFTIALAMERWNLHRRIALLILKKVGTRTTAIVGGFMGATAGLSMWISNTASTLMMIPIALSVVDLVSSKDEKKGRSLGICLLLGIGYAASIGGVGTLIGSPPNLLVASHLREVTGQEITFGRWLAVGLPVVMVFLPIAWFVLCKVLFPAGRAKVEGADELIEASWRELGPMTRGEKMTLAVFGAAAFGWIFRSWLSGIEIFGATPLAGLSDAGIAILAAAALFILPANPAKREFVMDWETTRKLPWGMLLLLGGGLSLADAVKANGVGEFLGAQVTGLAGIPDLLLIMAVVATVIFLTEITSNTATTATFVPILVSVAPILGMNPVMLAVPAAVAASCAFMLPVATPPNALVYATGRMSIRDMMRGGIWLNLIGVGIITALTYLVVMPLL